MVQEGAILVDGQEVADTVRCSHCGIHYVVVKGSGKRRGFCWLCNHRTCGSDECMLHDPFEKKLERAEKFQRAL